MEISSIEIKNFKSIEKLEVKFDSKFNLLIGKNNIGKTTIFEAILLWGKCYELNIQSKKKNFYANSKNIAFSDVKSLRIYEEKDLFNKIKGKGTIEIIVEIDDNGKKYRLGFEITNLVQEKKTYLQVNYIDKDEFKRFESLTGKYSKMLNELIIISRSKPVANIERKEPYMYKDQVLSKIAKGKGTGVLRNKIVALSKESRLKVEENISKVIGDEIKFIEESGRKEYISLKVEKDERKVDILSQGSGFLQLVEIFTTMEYKRGILNVLLIDEPDAHLHAELQMNLVDVIKRNENSQSFIISHNERFLNSIQEENIIFINKKDKKIGLIEPLRKGSKRLVLENLVDNISEIEELQYIDKLVWVEGKSDFKYIKMLYDKYTIINGEANKKIKFRQLNGVDKVNSKLSIISNIYKDFINKDTKWIVLKDKDLIPENKLEKAKKEIHNNIYYKNSDVIFQEGYELYSTLFSEKDKLIKLIVGYYEINFELLEVKKVVNNLLDGYMSDIFSPITKLYKKMESNFKRQKNNREGNVYKQIEFSDFLKSLYNNKNRIELIMEKSLIEEFINEIDRNFNKKRKEKLNPSNLFNTYIESIKSSNDFYKCHLDIMKLIYE